MKKVFLSFLCIAACISCGNNKYNIEAVYTAPDGTDIYLIDVAGNDTLAVTTVKDNAFSFTGQADEGIFAYVGHGNDRVHIILEPGTIKAEIPAIRKAYDAFKGDRFDVVSIACSDKREDTVKALSELDMPWNQILDAQKIPVELYGVATIPHLILFAPDGTILKRGLRANRYTRPFRNCYKERRYALYRLFRITR